MKHLKLIGSRWAGYTGLIGGVDFKDAVSVYPVPLRIADRIAAAIPMMELDDDGNEIGYAGAINRLRTEAAQRAPILEPLKVQTEEERKAEELEIALKQNKAPVDKFYTGEELQDIASTGGIKALRAVAEPWNVRGKAIPALIEAIVAAQSKFLDGKQGIITEVVEDKPEVSAEPDKLTQEALEAEALKEAAATGDLSAAFSTDPELIEKAQEAIDSGESLLGSSILLSSYEIEGETVTLGDLVAAAHKFSGLTGAEWNELEDDNREDLIRLELDRRLPKE